MAIYATIRQNSKYYDTQEEHNEKGQPIPFQVELAFDEDPWWPVKGGVGGIYTLYDVELWIAVNGRFETAHTSEAGLDG